jgi:hypothetical protein
MGQERIKLEARTGREDDPTWRELVGGQNPITLSGVRYPTIEEKYSSGRRRIPDRSGRDEPGKYEFWPVKIIKSTLTCDMGVGCYGCSFCVATSQPSRAVVQNPPYKNVLNGPQLFELIASTQVFRETDVRLRLFNDHDATLPPPEELAKLTQLVAYYDRKHGTSHPISFLTHRALSKRFLEFINGASKDGQNVILTASVTPPHPDLLYNYPMERQFETFNDVECPKVLNFAPLTSDTISDVRRVIEQGDIPKGTIVTLSPLAYYESVPAIRDGKITAQPANINQLEDLAACARDKGLIVYNSNECAIARIRHEPSLDYAEIHANHAQLYARDTGKNTQLPDQCEACDNLTCKTHHTVFSWEDAVAGINKEIEVLGFEQITALSMYPGLMLVDIETTENSGPVTKSDTGFLNNKFRVKVTAVNSVARPTADTLQRWDDKGFLPVKGLIFQASKLQAVKRPNTTIQEQEKHGKYDISAGSRVNPNHPDFIEDTFLTLPSIGSAAVFDGLGGNEAGEKASQIAKAEI